MYHKEFQTELIKPKFYYMDIYSEIYVRDLCEEKSCCVLCKLSMSDKSKLSQRH